MSRLVFMFLSLFTMSALSQTSGLPAPSVVTLYPNAASTGTTLNKLTKLTGAPSTAVITATSDTSGVVGVTIGNAGTSGVASIQTSGIVSIIFDGATTSGDYVQISSTVAGDAHDSGSSICPSSGQVVGRVLSTNGAGGTYQVNFGSNGCGAGGGGSGVTSINGSAGSFTFSGAGVSCTTTTCTFGGGGGYTNVTGSASETTVALINTACGTGTYYATTPLSIATGGTINCRVQFSKAGLWTGSVSITFAKGITETDAPAQHFSSGLTITLPQQTKQFTWWGAVGDGTTDDHAAIQACLNAGPGECVGGPLVYSVGTSTLTITTPNTGIAGVAIPTYATGITTTPTVIKSTSATATILDMHGSGSGSEIYGNTIHNITFARSTTPSGTAKNLDIEYTGMLNINNVWSNDGIYGFYFVDPRNATIYNNWANFGFNGFNETTGSVFGFEFFSPTGVGYFSPSIRNNVAQINTGVLATAYGFHFDGDLMSDINADQNTAFRMSYGLYVDGSGTGGGFHMSDFHFNNSTFDTISGACVFATGLNPTNEASVEISGGWCEASAGNYGIDIESSQGVSINNWQIYPTGGMLNSMILLHSSGRITVNGNHTFGGYASFHNPSQSLVLDGSSGNTVTGNSFTINSSSNICNVELKNTSTVNAISGNAFLGGSAGSNGICADATSIDNHYININSFDAYTVKIVDSGTGNQLTPGGTTTNALTMNNSGSGAASGSTFDGSAAKTISYNSIGAAPTASPTFTGTPDASGATQFKLPVSAAFASLANGECGYDSTNKNWHCWVNGADTLMVPLAASFTSGHCAQPTSSGGSWSLVDAGGACGVSGGGASFSATTSGTNTTAAMVVGSGATLDVSGTGTINATKIGGITITGTPSTGQVPTATSSSAATWQAAGGSGNYTNLCASVTLTNASCSSGLITVTNGSSTFTISAIPGTSINLELAFSGESSTGPQQVTIQANADTGSNYDWSYMANATNANSAGTTSITTAIDLSAQTGTLAGGGTLTIPNYSGATINKTFLTRGTVISSGTYFILTSGGNWHGGAAAITSLKFGLTGGNFQNTTVTIYGTN